jgi:FAD/FMN-containing dehydrogenase/Fe-S oxidoreductase
MDPYELEVDVAGLEKRLRKTVKGEVRFDTGSRALYATDASNWRHVPIGVVVPRDADDVVATVAACHAYGAPIVSRGGGTGLCGQTCNVAIVMDHSKYFTKILEVNVEEKWARVQPGVILDELRDRGEEHHLTYGPDPATHTHCTLGGMIGNNSCGVHSIMAGKTVDNIITLDVITYDGIRLTVGETTGQELEQLCSRQDRVGEIYRAMREIRDSSSAAIKARYPDIPRRVSGYNLDQLLPENRFNVARALVGSEGTLVTVLEAKVRLVHSPPARTLLVLGYPDVYRAGDHVPEVLATGPIGLEGIDDQLVGFMKKKGMYVEHLHLLPEGGGWLLVEFGAETKEEADAKARKCMDALRPKDDAPTMSLYDNKVAEDEIWAMRGSGLGATANVPGMPPSWTGWEDAAVDPKQVGDYLREFRKLLDKYGYTASLYGHFGDGCIHCRISFDLFTKQGVADYVRFTSDAADLVLKHGGSLSGEHGDGQSKAIYLPRMFGEELVEMFRKMKSAWDPAWKMNPGKVVDPWRPDEHLRLGPTYAPKNPRTNYAFVDDRDSFAHATLRCVGVGKCRRKDNAFMCPSYLATQEEEHSTRGRAHMLNEMVRGEVVKGGWRSKDVAATLDLCLGCKGCKKECPVGVDIAAYKSEFHSHQPWWAKDRTAWTMGWIGSSARLGAAMPAIANFLTHAPVLRGVSRSVAGISQHREVPRFAAESFRHWFRKHAPLHPNGEKVVLFPDVFNNCFLPESLKSCVYVLEHYGFQVIVPREWLGAVRPLLHFGWTTMARKQLRKVLDVLGPLLEEGVPVIVAEPSTASVFRDEMGMLLPGDRTAQKLRKQSKLLGEFIMERKLALPKMGGKVVFQGHCHEKAVLTASAMRDLLNGVGVEVSEPEKGCCGMAGAFGFETKHYDISKRIGEFNLLPGVRRSPESTMIVSDGFSCRTQIVGGTERQVLHSAEFLKKAIIHAQAHA